MGVPSLEFASLGLIALAYLIGSISFAVVISHAFGLQDPRTYGSGNPGATNVLRSGNKWAAGLTLLGDAAKGWFAVWAAERLNVSINTEAWVALAVFLGHLYPVFLRFKGGKGVATAFGVMLAIQPLLALGVAITWFVVAKLFKYSSLAALISAACAPIFYLLGNERFWISQLPLTGVFVTLALLLLYRHRANIERLFKGTEPRIGKKT
ncbi:MAG: glycerol-3-phosphate 1-O-acyltransferase PlsY [Alcaligenaceae bacterium]|jgi:glycerol-3-phosphate acyltransferase PlsY